MSRSRNRSAVARVIALSMPDRTNHFLTLAAGALFAFYIILVITTIMFATVQTSLAAEVRETEGTISQLETTYYAAIAKQDDETPASAGMVAPAAVTYAVAKPANGLSFAQ